MPTATTMEHEVSVTQYTGSPPLHQEQRLEWMFKVYSAADTLTGRMRPPGRSATVSDSARRASRTELDKNSSGLSDTRRDHVA